MNITSVAGITFYILHEYMSGMPVRCPQRYGALRCILHMTFKTPLPGPDGPVCLLYTPCALQCKGKEKTVLLNQGKLVTTLADEIAVLAETPGAHPFLYKVAGVAEGRVCLCVFIVFVPFQYKDQADKEDYYQYCWPCPHLLLRTSKELHESVYKHGKDTSKKGTDHEEYRQD